VDVCIGFRQDGNGTFVGLSGFRNRQLKGHNGAFWEARMKVVSEGPSGWYGGCGLSSNVDPDCLVGLIHLGQSWENPLLVLCELKAWPRFWVCGRGRDK